MVNLGALAKLSSYDCEELGKLGVEKKKLDLLCQLTQENESLLKTFLKKEFKTLPDWIKFTKRARRFLKL